MSTLTFNSIGGTPSRSASRWASDVKEPVVRIMPLSARPIIAPRKSLTWPGFTVPAYFLHWKRILKLFGYSEIADDALAHVGRTNRSTKLLERVDNAPEIADKLRRGSRRRARHRFGSHRRFIVLVNDQR